MTISSGNGVDMGLYTKTGDQGETGLFDGSRVPKDHLRVEAYGAVDETNALLGWASIAVEDTDLQEHLRQIQGDLFVVGADLATPGRGPQRNSIPTVEESLVSRLEDWIDEAENAVPALKTFILPSGCEAGCRLHVSRTACRRAERLTVRLCATEEIGTQVIPYLNRLSDLLFAWARLVNAQAGVTEHPWKPG